jgi:hypothetical protein
MIDRLEGLHQVGNEERPYTSIFNKIIRSSSLTFLLAIIISYINRYEFDLVLKNGHAVINELSPLVSNGACLESEALGNLSYDTNEHFWLFILGFSSIGIGILESVISFVEFKWPSTRTLSLLLQENRPFFGMEPVPYKEPESAIGQKLFFQMLFRTLTPSINFVLQGVLMREIVLLKNEESLAISELQRASCIQTSFAEDIIQQLHDTLDAESSFFIWTHCIIHALLLIISLIETSKEFVSTHIRRMTPQALSFTFFDSFAEAEWEMNLPVPRHH